MTTITKISQPNVPQTNQNSLVEKPAPEQQKLKPHLMSIPIPKQAARAYYFSQTYDGDDRATSVFFQVFGGKSSLPTIIRQTIGEYIPNELDECVKPLVLAQIKPTVQLERFVNLSDASTLMEHLGTPFRSETYLKEALRLVQSVYEAPTRYAGVNGGIVFPMQPELMSWLMINVPGKKVLEIGGADGTMGILLAYADAQKVYLNEPDRSEKQRYEALLKEVSKPIKKKLQFIGASCFDLLNINPNLKDEIDILFCGNLIHFFNDAEQDAFFRLLDKILKKDAIVVVTVNSAYAGSDSSIFEKWPDQTAYKIDQCGFRVRPGSFPELLLRELEPCSGDKISFNFTNVTLYSKEIGSKWAVNNTEFQKFNIEMQKKVQEAIERVKPRMKEVPEGRIFVNTNHSRHYTLKTLEDLFKKQSYQVLSVHTVDEQGHVCAMGEEWQKGPINTIICKKS